MPKMNYIAIEGPIGVGKTTLAMLLAKNFDTELVLEVVEENPFLLKFYDDIKKYAFQTQIFFLLSRYKQQQKIGRMVNGRKIVISDYTFFKDRVFATMNLIEEELELYEQVYAALNAKVPKPSLVIYLRAPVRVLVERIPRRGRYFERSITKEYLEKLSERYESFFAEYKGPLIKIDTEKINMLRSSDFRKILDILKPIISK